MQTEALARALRVVPETQWQSMRHEANGTVRQCAGVDFVPALPSEHKEAKPLRYVGLRLVKSQGELFAEGQRSHYHAVITPRDLPGVEAPAGIVPTENFARFTAPACRVSPHTSGFGSLTMPRNLICTGTISHRKAMRW